MKKILEKLIKDAKAEGAEVHVIHVNANELCDGAEPKKESEVDPLAEIKNDFAEIAKMNRILYEMHINAGFTKEEALALTVATITNK